MHILVTNDDGFHAPGIQALVQVLSEAGHQVVVAAPEQEKSAGGHALTLHKPLRVYPQAANAAAPGRFMISGTPADCVSIALTHLIKDPIDLVISGINMGPNLGSDVTYSGTVSGAMQATQMGLPAISISLSYNREKETGNFRPAAETAAYFAKCLSQQVLPPHTWLNINVPNFPVTAAAAVNGAPYPFKLSTMGFKRYSKEVVQRFDPRERTYYWITALDRGFVDNGTSDCEALAQGLVSVTPLHLDYTNYTFLEKMKQWQL